MGRRGWRQRDKFQIGRREGRRDPPTAEGRFLWRVCGAGNSSPKVNLFRIVCDVGLASLTEKLRNVGGVVPAGMTVRLRSAERNAKVAWKQVLRFVVYWLDLDGASRLWESEATVPD